MRLGQLAIDDETSFSHVALYGQLRDIVEAADYRFTVLPARGVERWDRALFLNLTFWGHRDGGDVLPSSTLAADVVTHVGWHLLAARALSPNPRKKPCAEALFLGEAIASAFDVYLVGRLLGHAPRSSFLQSQVPAMAETAQAAGLSARGFEKLLQTLARDPEAAFESLRALLYSTTVALHRCKGVDEAHALLTTIDEHPFAPLLHRFELSNWVLYARAYAVADPTARAAAQRVDRSLAKAKSSLQWLAEHWVAPAFADR